MALYYLIYLFIYFIFFQIFVFLTINKFGALNCALIGLFRKILSLLLSFVLYGHTVNAVQTVGLGLAMAAMIANFYEKVISNINLKYSLNNQHFNI